MFSRCNGSRANSRSKISPGAITSAPTRSRSPANATRFLRDPQFEIPGMSPKAAFFVKKSPRKVRALPSFSREKIDFIKVCISRYKR